MRDSNPAFGTIEILKGNMVSRRVPFFLEIGPCGLHDGNGNWDHLNLIFPVYLKWMTGFPSFHPEDIGAELLH
jgi:hypothetical protein